MEISRTWETPPFGGCACVGALRLRRLNANAQDALIRSEAMLKSEQSDVAQAQRAEEQLREALARRAWT